MDQKVAPFLTHCLDPFETYVVDLFFGQRQKHQPLQTLNSQTMVTYLVRFWFQTCIEMASDVIHNTVECIESIQVFGYTVNDLPLIPRILKALNVLTVYDKMEIEIDNLRLENHKLHESIDEMRSLNNSLRSEIEDFRALKENLQKFAQEQNEDFREIVANMNDNYQRYIYILFSNMINYRIILCTN